MAIGSFPVIRRVVTGMNENGRADFVSDGPIDYTIVTPTGIGVAIAWGTDTTIQLPSQGVQPQYTAHYPPPGGFRVEVVQFGPERAEPDPATLPQGHPLEMRPHAHDDERGHWTETIDMGIVVEGEIYAIAEDGAETLLRQGDIIIQNGTPHSWSNRSDGPCTMFFALVGAELKTEGLAS